MAAGLENLTLLHRQYLLAVRKGCVHVYSLAEESQRAEAEKCLNDVGWDLGKLIMSVLDQWPFGPHFVNIEDPGKIDTFSKKLTVMVSPEGDVVALQHDIKQIAFPLPDIEKKLLTQVQNRSLKLQPEQWVVDPEQLGNKAQTKILLQKLQDKFKDNDVKWFLDALPDLVEKWNKRVNVHYCKEPQTKLKLNQIMKTNDPKQDIFDHLAPTKRGIFQIGLGALLNMDFADPRRLLRNSGFQGIWLDQKNKLIIIGSKQGLQNKLTRKPSCLHFGIIEGNWDPDFIVSLLDVDFIRINQYAGHLFPTVWIREAKERDNVIAKQQ